VNLFKKYYIKYNIKYNIIMSNKILISAVSFSVCLLTFYKLKKNKQHNKNIDSKLVSSNVVDSKNKIKIMTNEQLNNCIQSSHHQITTSKQLDNYISLQIEKQNRSTQGGMTDDELDRYIQSHINADPRIK
jgi:hypothetical protein